MDRIMRLRMFDWVLARLAIFALRHIFGACEPPYEPDCLSCKTAQIIIALKDVP